VFDRVFIHVVMVHPVVVVIVSVVIH
jgi:hypothetical protein